MIDIKDLRENPEKYRKGAELKGIEVEIARIIDLDEQRVRAQQELESLRSEQNKQSKEIAKIKDAAAKKEAIAKMGELAGNVKQAEERLKNADAAMQPLLLQIPKPPDEDVPVGKDARENVTLYRWGEPRRFEFKPKSHIELGESLDLMDFKAGANIAGARSYFLKGMGAELHQALLRLALDMMTKEKGFTALSVPVLVREVAMQGIGFFPAGREQTYYVQADELYLTGTAEVGLTAYHMNETLDESELPKKYVAVSTCFRREAG